MSLSLDEVPETLECRVVGVEGSVSRLVNRDQLPPGAVGLLVHGASGYLVFEEFGKAVGLRVIARANPPYLDVAIMDGLAVQERRAHERVKLVTRARIAALSEHDGDGPADWTHTIDLSEGGALLHDHRAFSGQQRVTLQLSCGDDPQPIATQARIVRRAHHAVAVAFESIQPGDAARLGEFLAGIQGQRRLVSHT